MTSLSKIRPKVSAFLPKRAMDICPKMVASAVDILERIIKELKELLFI